MEVLGPKLCPKHNLEAHKICTSPDCFQEKDILVCANCSSKHFSRQCQVIEVSLLNEKVHELMKKRVDFEINYQQACDEWLIELKKFKIFKEDIMTILNTRERALNDICRKIRRTIPYEKDRHLFKKTLSYVYLATRGLNPNYELYQKFNDGLAETINDCNRCLHKLRLNHSEIPTLLKKQNQICAILKQCSQSGNKLSIAGIKWTEPVISQFRKETIKYNKILQAQNTDSQIYRISEDEFLSHNIRSKVINLYNSKNLAIPKMLYIGSEVQNVEVLGKNLFITNPHSNIFIYDLLNEKIIKEYASSNHKQAHVTALLSLDRQHILNFVHNPNQIVCLKFDEVGQTLKVSKGLEMKARCITATSFGDNFVSSFDDKTIKIFNSQTLQQDGQYELENINVRSLAVMDSQTILAGGESQIVYLIDQRAHGIVGKFNMQSSCSLLKKIYPSTILTNLGNCLKLYEYRMQKQLTRIPLDNPARYLQVLSSSCFVTSGKSISIYSGMA